MIKERLLANYEFRCNMCGAEYYSATDRTLPSRKPQVCDEQDCKGTVEFYKANVPRSLEFREEKTADKSSEKLEEKPEEKTRIYHRNALQRFWDNLRGIRYY